VINTVTGNIYREAVWCKYQMGRTAATVLRCNWVDERREKEEDVLGLSAANRGFVGCQTRKT